jgi:misacylated tRNA(Ala) deacylase
MDTSLLYQTDSYLKEFDAEVVGTNEDLHGVILDRTAFYPGGGGQPSDKGFLRGNGEYPVVKLQKTPEGIIHIIDPETTLPKVGEPVHGVLDWERRYQLMRTHTALHILCGVVYRDYGAQVTGGDMEPLKGRMDFEFEGLQKELVHEIEESVNREVLAAHPISVAILPRDEAFKIPDLIRTKINLLPEGIKEVRVVNLEGLDLQADGGTHVANTRDVGRIKITDYKSKGKINKRIYLDVV